MSTHETVDEIASTMKALSKALPPTGRGTLSYTDDQSISLTEICNCPAHQAPRRAVLNRDRLTRAIAELPLHNDLHLQTRTVWSDVQRARGGVSTFNPGCEALVHAALPHRWVAHLRTPLFDAVAAGKGGATAVQSRLKGIATWIEASPSLIDVAGHLAQDAHHAPHAYFASYTGVIVAAETPEELVSLVTRIEEALSTGVPPTINGVQRDTNALNELGEAVARSIAEVYAVQGLALSQPQTVSFATPYLLELTNDAKNDARWDEALSCDSIAYRGERPCFVTLPTNNNSPHVLHAQVLHAVHEYCAEWDCAPRIVVVRNRGVVAVNGSERAAEHAFRQFLSDTEAHYIADNLFGATRGIAPQWKEWVHTTVEDLIQGQLIDE